MRKILFTLLTLCAMTASAQKFIDDNGVLWSSSPLLSPKAVDVDYRGLKYEFDSLDVYLKIAYNGALDIDISNGRSSEVYIIWDETNMNSSPIVFTDMMTYQIGSSIKPTVIDSHGYLSKQITSETYARNAIPIVNNFMKDQAKKNKYTTIILNLSLAVRQGDKTSRYKIYMEGLWDGKKVKNYKELNEKQDFSELEQKYEKLKNGK